ncbi:unnamed protein product [Rotaria sp. Silwood2]|nr:unnamed protein product [Rotaria sp. Silwood2]CAF2528997.1 unnamed protein product [Rotaria sp. Silwood2]CAF2786843.1 unnamed protein product [Rotaria sp. Silwood2]CAF2931929.1 unnamed protein product [Rotaria sp. Silwood2]CAF3903365.1 unnamed protein product [Rotaria sp. Silwood2]
MSSNTQPTLWKTEHTVPGRPVFGAQHPPLSSKLSNKKPIGTNPSMSKKKDQEKFHEYAINTDDAWEIDDGTMSLKLIDNDNNNNGNDDDYQTQLLSISKQAVDEVASKVIQEHKSKSQSNKITLDASAVRRPVKTANISLTTCPGIGRRIGDYPNIKPLVPIRYATTTANNNSNSSLTTSNTRSNLVTKSDIDIQKENKFKQIFEQSNIDLNELRKASWNGIPKQYRAQAWKLLCGYLPPKVERREDTLTRKRDEYWCYVSQYYHTRTESEHQDTFRQIHIDIPRMNPLMPIFQQTVVQELFERILFIWAIRHPASGYVQGINDLVTPFFVVFLSEFIENDFEIENFDISSLPETNRKIVEADSYWATSHLLEGIQDNYTFAQPGIQYKVRTLEELVKRIDEPLYRHLKNQHIEFLQFAFRWMNNLLMRELPVRCTIRLWDTYLSEQNGFSQFHLYICASFLVRFSKDLLREKDFQGILLLLQNLPTHSWTSNDISILTAEAYQLKVMFANAPRHLSS